MPVAVAVVALTAGLAVATFVKAFGIGFLARPRSAAAGAAVESPPSMLAGLALTAALLHLVNHAAFKTVLFCSAGSVLRAAGSRNLDALGGLR